VTQKQLQYNIAPTASITAVLHKHLTGFQCLPWAFFFLFFSATAALSSASAVRGFGRPSPEGPVQQRQQQRQGVTLFSV